VSAPRVGVLALQGDFACHRSVLETLGAEAVRVTLPRDLEDCAALILPGGESTTMVRMLEHTGLRAPLEAFVRTQPVLGTCAGLILLAARTGRLPGPPLAAIDAEVDRNAYGRQIDSFAAPVDVLPLGRRVAGVFIRAPRIVGLGPDVEVIARLAGAHGPAAAGEPVGVRAGHVVGLCFHPELTADTGLHAWFLNEVAGLGLAVEDAGRPDGAAA
jgi:5'-phosphate synthase pdxT subunit